MHAYTISELVYKPNHADCLTYMVCGIKFMHSSDTVSSKTCFEWVKAILKLNRLLIIRRMVLS